MNSPLSQAPIASPHGAGQLNPPAPVRDEKAAHLVVSLPLAAVCRYAVFEWLNLCVLLVCLGIPFVMALAFIPVGVQRLGVWVFPVAFIVLLLVIVGLSIPINFLVRLLSRRLFVIQISKRGLSKIYGRRDIHFPWRKFQRVIERKGDLWIASFSDGCFVPREAFVSSEEAREFVAIVRGLVQSGGDSWRSEWEGRVFSVHPDGCIALVGE